MEDPLAELAGYFRCRSEVPDAELVRLVAGARAGGGWDVIAVCCGVRDYHDITGVVGLPCWEASDTGAELLFSAAQYAMRQLIGGRGLFRPLRWLCPSCGQQVADRAPAGRPVHVEHGHAPGCARLSGDQAAEDWQRRDRLPGLIVHSEDPAGAVQRHWLAEPITDDCRGAAGAATSTTTSPPSAGTGAPRSAITATRTCTRTSPSPFGTSQRAPRSTENLSRRSVSAAAATTTTPISGISLTWGRC